jgi:phosphoribosylaminoimidazole carboxylase PurE protein
MSHPRVAILMGSDSDLSVMRGAADVLAGYGVAHEVKVLSAHRSPARAVSYVEAAPDRGIQVFICGAGMAAHLAGVVAAHTALPVIGVPLKSSAGLAGADALYSTVMMPPGIPVATVGIGGAKNAAHLAVRILALGDAELAARVEQHRVDMDAGVAVKNERLDVLGIDGYLAEKGS